MVTASQRLLLDGSECLDAARRQGLSQRPTPPSVIKEANSVRSTNWPSDSVPVSADDAVEDSPPARKRRAEGQFTSRLRVPRGTKSVSVNDPFAQSQSSSERLEQHTRSLPSPQSSLTPLSSSILADMRSSSKESKDQECASVGTTLTTSNVGYLSRPMVLPPPPDHDASSPADDAWSWKSVPAYGSACVTPAGTMMDTTPIHTEAADVSTRVWSQQGIAAHRCQYTKDAVVVKSCELRFWLEAMETAQKADLLQDPARLVSSHGRPKPNRLHKELLYAVDVEVNALRQQVQQERDVARSELAELKAKHERLQESEEKLRQGQRELEAQRAERLSDSRAKHCRPSRASSARVQAAHRPSEVQIARRFHTVGMTQLLEEGVAHPQDGLSMLFYAGVCFRLPRRAARAALVIGIFFGALFALQWQRELQEATAPAEDWSLR
eukprot:s1579_g18.t1